MSHSHPNLNNFPKPKLSEITPKFINENIEIPQGRSCISVKESEAEFMYHFLKSQNCARTLEVGMGFGRSACHILAATQGEHTAMDPFQSDYNSLGVKNIEKMGLIGNLDFHADYSHNVLPKLHSKSKAYDFIFIDGDHKFDGILVDFYFADLMLEKGGYILLHDTWMRSTQQVMSFIKTNRKDYEFVKTGLRNLAMVRKVGDDKRNGMHCREFYTLKNVFLHPIIMWMSEGKDTFLKKAAIAIKDKIK